MYGTFDEVRRSAGARCETGSMGRWKPGASRQLHTVITARERRKSVPGSVRKRAALSRVFPSQMTDSSVEHQVDAAAEQSQYNADETQSKGGEFMRFQFMALG